MKNRLKIYRRFLAGVMSLTLCVTAIDIFPVLSVNAEDEETTESDQLECVPGEIVVVYDNGRTSEEAVVETIGEDTTVQSTQEVSTVDDVTTTVIQTEEAGNEEATASALQQEDGVLAASPNYILELYEDETVNDPQTDQQDYLSTVKAYDAWDLLEGEEHEKVRVAVLDTGCDLDHEDLTGVLNKDLSAEILSADGIYGELKGDDYSLGKETSSGKGHGTHICGTIAAEANNEAGIAGVASGKDNSIVDLVAVDVFSDTTTSLAYVLAGLEYARSIQCKVINLSLGIKAAKVGDDSVFRAAIQKLYDEGIIVVCASGNYGTNDNGEIVTIPADYETTIGVISVDSTNQRSDFSDYGTLKDVCAPGDVYSTMPGNDYGIKSGTSMSAAIVSGVVAMMCSVDPSLTCTQVKEYLAETAVDIGDAGVDAETSNGLVDAKAAVSMALDKKGGSEPEEEVVIPYTDVSESDWYYDVVKTMYKTGIMTGKSVEIFDPNASITRAEFAVMMYRLAGKPEVTYQDIYPDVSSGQFYSEAVTWAKQAGVITGYDNGNFGPNDPVTREQIATILYRYDSALDSHSDNSAEYSSFPDGNQVDAFASEGMKWAIGSKIIQGTSDGYLKPRSSATRAECAAMFARYMAG